VQVDSLALQMRPRTPYEAADLGVRLCQVNARAVYRCYFTVAIPIVIVALSLLEYSTLLPGFFLWWAKPWLDRTVLFVLARAAFGQQTTVGDLWREQRAVWWRQLILTWTWRRLSPWRSFTQAVYQLEGHSFGALRKRVSQLRNRYTAPAYLMTFAFAWAETGLTISIASLVFWFAPKDSGVDFGGMFNEEVGLLTPFICALAYALAVLFLEPFYVAAGFGMYLNRRAELEAWDIEQEFRRAFS
jgi:hypothetical protein